MNPTTKEENDRILVRIDRPLGPGSGTARLGEHRQHTEGPTPGLRGLLGEVDLIRVRHLSDHEQGHHEPM